jgi:long-subunit fatty acid transport protein
MRKTIVTILLCAGAAVRADEYHNINGFFGERAAGLAGAYTAVADDPSGSYYNPAGLAFAYDNFISISASSYRETRKSYVNVFGPGQSYTRTSRSYIPNFFGAVKSFGEIRFGFSIVSPSNDDYDQADQILFPVSLNRVTSFQNDYTERNATLLVGPSLARAFGNKLALGGTLYYLYDSKRVTTSQLVSRKDQSYLSTSLTDRRRTMGLQPVLGLQYMPSDTVSLGFSLRRPFVTAEKRQKSGTINDSSGSSASITMIQSTTNYSAAGRSGSAVVGIAESGGVPETLESRIGVAFFPSRYWMIAADWIHTDGYLERRDRTQADINGDLYLNSPEVQLLTRRPTNNIAFGTEYYLSENFAVRLGYFTNRANSTEIDWLDGTIAAAARNAGRNYIRVPLQSAGLYYNIPGADARERFEYAHLHGYTLGLSWGDARSSLTVSYILEKGQGSAQIDSGQSPQKLRMRSSSIMIVASTKT